MYILSNVGKENSYKFVVKQAIFVIRNDYINPIYKLIIAACQAHAL